MIAARIVIVARHVPRTVIDIPIKSIKAKVALPRTRVDIVSGGSDMPFADRSKVRRLQRQALAAKDKCCDSSCGDYSFHSNGPKWPSQDGS